MHCRKASKDREIEGSHMFRVRAVTWILGVSLGLAGCAGTSSRHDSATGAYTNSALSNQNPAPQSMSPPADSSGENVIIDDLYLRTNADYHFALGEAYSLEGRSEKAVEEFRLALVYDAKAALIHMRLAAEYIKLGLVSEALEQARVAVEKEPDNRDAHLLMGGLLSALKIYDSALKEYSEILRIDPMDLEAPLYIGAIYAEQKKYPLAQSYFRRLGDRVDFKNRHLALYYLGRSFVEEGLEKHGLKAERAFLAAIKVQPKFDEAVLALGKLYVDSKQETKALILWSNYQKNYGPSSRLAEPLAQLYVQKLDFMRAYEQFEILLANRPDDIGIQFRMALILIEQKKYTEARDRLQEILEQEPTSDRVRFYLGAVYEELKDYDNALENLVQMPASSNYYQESMIHASYLSKLKNRPDQAARIISQAIESRPDIQPFYSFYVALLEEQKKHSEALVVLGKATQLFPKQTEFHFALGSTYDRLGDKENTVKSMLAVLEIDANHIQALNYLAYTYAEQNIKLDEAEKMVRRALQMQPNDGYILDTLGWVLHKQGNHGEAVKVLEAAYRSQNQESIIAEHLGDAYFSYQLYEKARQMYIRAVEVGLAPEKLLQVRAKIAGIDDLSRRSSGQRLPASQ
jgi:tetratricopeptide (TPR) repeat protein